MRNVRTHVKHEALIQIDEKLEVQQQQHDVLSILERGGKSNSKKRGKKVEKVGGRREKPKFR